MNILLISFCVVLSLAVIILTAALAYVSRISKNRLVYIKDSIDLLYVYGKHDAVKFYDKCKDLSDSKQLARYGIVGQIPVRHFRCKWHRLTPAEKQLLTLMNAGFSNRELSVIFNVGKVSSIYVKHYRAKAK